MINLIQVNLLEIEIKTVIIKKWEEGKIGEISVVK